MTKKHTCNQLPKLPGMSRRHAVTRLLQVMAGALGVTTIAGCPGGSTWGRTKLVAGHSSGELKQDGSDTPEGNIELNIADIPVDKPYELSIAGKKAYLSRELVDGAEVWHATSRVCTHMKCTVSFNADAQEYHCPCHRSSFALDGSVLKPPAKRDLQRWEVLARDGVVEIVVDGAGA